MKTLEQRIKELKLNIRRIKKGYHDHGGFNPIFCISDLEESLSIINELQEENKKLKRENERLEEFKYSEEYPLLIKPE